MGGEGGGGGSPAVVWVHRVADGPVCSKSGASACARHDLHDDICLQPARQSPSLNAMSPVSTTADASPVNLSSGIVLLSRELVDSIGEIVWAIHPHKDYHQLISHTDSPLRLICSSRAGILRCIEPGGSDSTPIRELNT